MRLSDINPFVRYAELQPSILFGSIERASYDFRLFYILEGNGELEIDGLVVSLRENSAIYLCPSVFYRFIGDFKVLVLNYDLDRENDSKKTPISPSRRKHFAPERVIKGTPPEELSEYFVVYEAYSVKEMFEKCISNFDANDALSDSYTSSAVKYILSVLLQEKKRDEEGTRTLSDRITFYIKANFDKELTNESIAAYFNYHPFYLNRVFKRHTGTTIHKALLEVRLQIAKQLLIKTDISIEQVMKRSGFGSRSGFIECFENECGMSPRAFREKERSLRKRDKA